MTYEDLHYELESYLYHSWSPHKQEEYKQQTVTVYIKELDEWFPIEKLRVTTEDDALDRDHLYLETK